MSTVLYYAAPWWCTANSTNSSTPLFPHHHPNPPFRLHHLRNGGCREYLSHRRSYDGISLSLNKHFRLPSPDCSLTVQCSTHTPRSDGSGAVSDGNAVSVRVCFCPTEFDEFEPRRLSFLQWRGEKWKNGNGSKNYTWWRCHEGMGTRWITMLLCAEGSGQAGGMGWGGGLKN